MIVVRSLNKEKISSNLKMLRMLPSLKRTSKTVEEIRSILEKTLDYNYEITQYDDESFISENIEEHLGQVRTPAWVAEIISNLCIKEPNLSMLDPCFGDGVFLESAYKRIKELDTKKIPDICGIEIDLIRFAEGLQNYSKILKNKFFFQQSFFCGNIFDFEKKSFDCIMMNPPYTRQEDLSDENNYFANKEKIHEKIRDISGITLSLRSNLYIYFVVYLSSLLKNQGRMGVILPKGWLDSKHGIEFQKFLLNNFEIEFIIDFTKDTFESVIVEDCVLILKKNPDLLTKVSFVHIYDKINLNEFEKIRNRKKSFETERMSVSIVEKNALFEDHKWGKFLQLNPDQIRLLEGKNLVPFSEFAEIHRGVETNWNEFFILDGRKVNQLGIRDNFLKKIISSPKKLKKLDTKKNVDFDYLLSINTPLKSSDNYGGIKKYVDDYYEKILEKKENTILKKQAEKNPNSWYVSKPFKSSPIIFSYIIRKTKFFIKNSEGYLVRDNFYNIFPKHINSEILFSLLNSSLSRLQLELIGRRYGNGILKVQAYELRGLRLPDVRKMPEKIKNELIESSRELSKFSILDDRTLKVINNIDMIVEKFCKLKISSKEIKEMEKNMIESRMERN